MRIFQYLPGGGDDVPTLRKGNAAVLEDNDSVGAITGFYQTLVVAALATTLASQQAQASRINGVIGTEQDESIVLLKGNAAALDDEGYLPPPRVVTQLTRPVFIEADEFGSTAVQAVFDESWTFTLPAAVTQRPQAWPTEEEFAPVVVSDDDWKLPTIQSRWVTPSTFTVDDDFVTVVVSDDDTAQAVPSRQFAPQQQQSVFEGEFLPVVAPSIAFDDEATPTSLRVQVPIAPVAVLPDEELPQFVAAPFVTDDTDATIAQRSVPNAVIAFAPNEECPQLVTPQAAIDETWTPQPARSTTQIAQQVVVEEEFVPQQAPHVTTDDDSSSIASVLGWPIRRAVFTPEEFPQLAAAIPVVASAVGKYKPEHDSAIVDLGAAHGFATEQAGALSDIGAAHGFDSEHAGALKDLGNAGI